MTVAEPQEAILEEAILAMLRAGRLKPGDREKFRQFAEQHFSWHPSEG